MIPPWDIYYWGVESVVLIFMLTGTVDALNLENEIITFEAWSCYDDFGYSLSETSTELLAEMKNPPTKLCILIR